MNDKWEFIPGYEGLYKINTNGDVYSLYRNKIMKAHLNKQNGYAQIILKKDKKHKTLYIHRLVAQTFIENPNNLACINHKNEVKTDNSVDNLEWCSKAYNNAYNGKDQRICKPIRQLSPDGNLIKIWTSARQASQALGIQYKNISAVVRGKRNFCGRFRWEYAV